jgi:hypothetical protein
MSSLVHSPEFEDWGRQSQPRSTANISPSHLLRSIPPERIGLNGEYDHSGLAKRVDRTFRQQFLSEELAKLTVTQRGRVVILTGCIANPQLLDRLIKVALNIMGANYVETYGVTLLEGSRPGTVLEPDFLSRCYWEKPFKDLPDGTWLK